MTSSGRKIVVFGISGLRTVKREVGELLFADNDFEGHLGDFDIIIYCVGAFKHIYEKGPLLDIVLKAVPSEAVRRENEIGVALERGKTVCIVGLNSDDYVVSGVFKHYGIPFGPMHYREVFRNLQTRRSEFKSFIDDVGATQIGFSRSSVNDVICLAGEAVAGFSKKVENGLLLFIPCLWGSNDPSYIIAHIEKLAAGLVAYQTKLIAAPPGYIEQFQFAKEKASKAEIERITNQLLNPLQADLEFYSKMKSILWLGDNALVNAVDAFLKQMGFQTQIDETYEEDLWIVDGSEREIIVEVKGLNKNLTRQDISKLDEHREAREVPNLPGLLIANTFMAADSLETKDQGFPPNVIEKAVNSNLLITRAIDLCRIFDCLEQASAKKLLDIIRGAKGWLTFKDEKIQLVST